MPGPDFLIFEPKSIESVKTIPASYATVMNFMRMVLCRKCVGLTINEALQYSLHSWRHLYPTMGTQLGLADSLQEAIGHWKKGSSMPQTYDAMINSMENRAKQHVFSVVAQGFRVAAPGEFLMADPLELSKAALDALTDSDTKQADVLVETEIISPVKVGAEKFWSFTPIQVVNTSTKKVHLYCPGDFAICEKWVTATPKEPALDSSGKSNRDFKESWNSVELKVLDDVCQLCYSEKVCAKFKEFSGGKEDITPYNALRQAVYDPESSDGDSFIISHSSDSSSDNDSS